MVVMDGVCLGGSNDPVSAAAAAAAINPHRAWYDASAAAALQQGGEDINAYFKATGSNASSYFSQMQDAYSGMSSYHGNFHLSAGPGFTSKRAQCYVLSTMHLTSWKPKDFSIIQSSKKRGVETKVPIYYLKDKQINNSPKKFCRFHPNKKNYLNIYKRMKMGNVNCDGR